jgi:hypothetical protein
MQTHFTTSTVLLAHEIGLYDALLKRPMTPDELALDCHIQRNAAEALLRILQTREYVEQRNQRYSLTDFARHFLTRSGSCTVAPLMDLMAAQTGSFRAIQAGLKTGAIPPDLDISEISAPYRAYVDAVNVFLHRASADLLSQIDLSGVETAIVGSMGVSFSALLLTHAPKAQITYGCLPHLVREIPRLQREYNVPNHRVDGLHEHVGEPEQDTWGGQSFDLVLLTKKMLLEPEHKLGERFARKAFEVLRPGGVALFWETVHPDTGPTPSPQILETVLSLGTSPAADVLTRKGLRQTLRSIGYTRIEWVPCLLGQMTFIAAYKER